MARAADGRVSLAGQGLFVGVATSASSSNACLVDIGGEVVSVRTVLGLTVAIGNVLLIARYGSNRWAIAKLASAPAAPPPPPPPEEVPPLPPPPVPPPPAPLKPDESPPPPPPTYTPAANPVVTTGYLICPAVQTATYRNGKWRTDIGPVNSADLYQGRYGGSSFGQNTGVAFYGDKPRSLAGATITAAGIRVWRLHGGAYKAQSPTLRLVTQSLRPAGAPLMTDTATGPLLAVGQLVQQFWIPASWGQAIVDGNAGGIAVDINTDNPYMRFAGRAAWSVSFTLILHWRRG